MKFLKYILIFVFLILFFSYFQNTSTIIDPDSFYHAKIAIFLSKGKLIKNFIWLPYTTLGYDYIDHHFLYHLYLVPFVKFFKPLIGIKISQILLSSLAVFSVYLLMQRYNIRYSYLYLFSLLITLPFLFRALLIKAPMLSLIFLILGIYFIWEKKLLQLFILSFLYVLAYGAWPLILLIDIFVIIGDIIREIIEQKEKNSLDIKSYKEIIAKLKNKDFIKADLKLLSITILGLVGGCVINPYFPKNLKFYWIQIVQIGVINYHNIIDVGQEWYPYSFPDLLSSTPIINILIIISIVLFFLQIKKQDKKTWSLFFLTLFFYLYTLKARRSIEYLAPFSILFSGFTINKALENKKMLPKILDLLKLAIPTKWIRISLIITISLVLLLNTISLKEIKQKEDSGFKLDYLKKSSNFLKNNTKKGDIIMHSCWDIFPFLFYYDDYNRYISGLDNTFLYEQSKNLYQEFTNINKAKIKKNLALIIKNDFKANYFLVQKDKKNLKNILEKDKNFKKIYSDNEVNIYKIKSQNNLYQ